MSSSGRPIWTAISATGLPRLAVREPATFRATVRVHPQSEGSVRISDPIEISTKCDATRDERLISGKLTVPRGLSISLLRAPISIMTRNAAASRDGIACGTVPLPFLPPKPGRGREGYRQREGEGGRRTPKVAGLRAALSPTEKDDEQLNNWLIKAAARLTRSTPPRGTLPRARPERRNEGSTRCPSAPHEDR